MACKVAARHLMDDVLEAVVALESDNNSRVAAAAIWAARRIVASAASARERALKNASQCYRALTTDRRISGSLRRALPAPSGAADRAQPESGVVRGPCLGGALHGFCAFESPLDGVGKDSVLAAEA